MSSFFVSSFAEEVASFLELVLFSVCAVSSADGCPCQSGRVFAGGECDAVQVRWLQEKE